MTGFDQLGEMAEEQREQQHLDVRAVDVGVTQDTDLAIAQTAHVGGVVGAMRVHADGHRHVVHLVVGEQTVSLDLPGVEHLAAQRQHGLAFFVAAHLGAATRAVALDQKQFVVGQIAAFAIGQLAGQHRHARAFAFLHFLTRFLAQLRGADDQFGEFLAVVHMGVEPQVQGGFDKA